MTEAPPKTPSSLTGAPVEPPVQPLVQVDEARLRHPDSIKWTAYPDDVLPLWVADMDFPPAPGIVAALQERLTRGLGYHQLAGDPQLLRLLGAELERQGFGALPEGGIRFLPGVVQGLYASVMGLTAPGDDVITVVPIYPPFLSAIRDHGRSVRAAPLRETEDGWRLDMDALEQAVTPATRLLLLCHPHNPTGRVWTKGELAQLAGFALRHRLYVVCDELHAPLSFMGEHVPFVTALDDDGLDGHGRLGGDRGGELRARTVTLTGPCKTYNTAGLGIGAMVSHDPALTARLARSVQGLMGHESALSVAMWRAALEDDGAWLAAVMTQLRENRDRVTRWAADVPGLRYHAPQATYLAWLDLREHREARRMTAFLRETARVALNDGPTFGSALENNFRPVSYDGFVRLNFATSPAILDEALRRIGEALKG